MDVGLTGKTALVCCAASGLGAACARRLRAEGAEVIGMYRPRTDPPPGPEATRWIACDVTSADAVRTAVRELPRVDIVVHVPVREAMSSVFDATEADYAGALDRGFYPCLALIQELLPAMAERGYGRFIQLAGASVLAPLWDHVLSNVARAAALALSGGAAREAAARGVTFNTIVLGLFDTPGLQSLWEERTGGDRKRLEEYVARRLADIPGGRMGDPEQCALLCALLASPAMGYLNGQSIRLDGGRHLGL